MSSISSVGSGVNFVWGGGLSFEVVEMDVEEFED